MPQNVKYRYISLSQYFIPIFYRVFERHNNQLEKKKKWLPLDDKIPGLPLILIKTKKKSEELEYNSTPAVKAVHILI